MHRGAACGESSHVDTAYGYERARYIKRARYGRPLYFFLHNQYEIPFSKRGLGLSVSLFSRSHRSALLGVFETDGSCGSCHTLASSSRKEIGEGTHV